MRLRYKHSYADSMIQAPSRAVRNAAVFFCRFHDQRQCISATVFVCSVQHHPGQYINAIYSLLLVSRSRHHPGQCVRATSILMLVSGSRHRPGQCVRATSILLLVSGSRHRPGQCVRATGLPHLCSQSPHMSDQTSEGTGRLSQGNTHPNTGQHRICDAWNRVTLPALCLFVCLFVTGWSWSKLIISSHIVNEPVKLF